MEHLLGLDTCDTLELRRERKGKEVPQNSEEYERGRVPVGEVRYTLSRFQARPTPSEMYHLACVMQDCLPWSLSTLDSLGRKSDGSR